MSSPDNPQFEPQSPINTEPAATDAVVPVSPRSVTLTPTVEPPVEDPVWSGWDVLAMTGLILISILVLQMAVLFAAQWIAYPRANLAEVAQKPILLLVSQLLIYLAVATCMMLLVEGKYGVAFWPAVRWNWRSAGWGALGLGVVLFLGLTLLQNFLPMPKDTPFEHLFARPRDAYLISLMAVTLGPLMEELFFHGFLYPVLARRMGVFWGVFLSALAFGLIHLPQYGWAWAAGLVIFLVGIVCGIVRAATKSVAASFLVHVGYNGAQMVIALVATQGFRHLEKAMAVTT